MILLLAHALTDRELWSMRDKMMMAQFAFLFLQLAISNINFIGCLATVNVIVNNKIKLIDKQVSKCLMYTLTDCRNVQNYNVCNETMSIN